MLPKTCLKYSSQANVNGENSIEVDAIRILQVPFASKKQPANAEPILNRG